MALTKVTSPISKGIGTRAELVSLEASGSLSSVVDGEIRFAGDFAYKRLSGSTAISNLPNWVPAGDVFANHFATNTTPGTTDMSAAILAAISYVVSLGGGTVNLKGETYAVSDQSTTPSTWDDRVAIHILNDKVHLKGVPGSKLFLLASEDAHVIKVGARDDSDLGLVSVSHVTIEGIEIDGNRTNQTTATDADYHGAGVDVADGCSYVILKDLYIHDIQYYGIGFQREGHHNCRVENVRIADTGADGFDAKNDDGTGYNNSIEGIDVKRFGLVAGLTVPQTGIDIRSGWTCTHFSSTDFGSAKGTVGARYLVNVDADFNATTASGFHFGYVEPTTASGTQGVRIDAPKFSMTNVDIVGCGEGTRITAREGHFAFINAFDGTDGFVLGEGTNGTDGDQVTFTSCTARGNTGIGFEIEANVIRPEFIGCDSRANATGLRIASGVTDLLWMGGSISANTTVNLNNSGTNTAIRETSGLAVNTLRVMAAEFGAIGDGATDDTAAIAAAMTYVNGQGGGTVVLGPRTYCVDGADDNGGVALLSGVYLEGQGPGRTTLKNITDEWKMVIGIRGGSNMGVRNLTIDGDWPTLDPHPSDAKRGEGIVFWNGSSECFNCTLENLIVKNCAHYGIGKQNVAARNLLIRKIELENIGGDGIDLKSFDMISGSAEDPDWAVTLEDIYVKSYAQNGDHDDQAGVDIRGPVIARGITVVDTWDLQVGQTAKTGIRFNADVNSNDRIGAHKATLTGFNIGSTKPDGDGNATTEKITGLEISANYVSVSNGYIENQVYGLKGVAAGDTPNPTGGKISDVEVYNCKSDTTIAVGLDIGSDCRGFLVSGVRVGSSETGFNIRGLYHQVRGNAASCDVGLSYNSASDNTLGIVFNTCTTNISDSSSDYAETGNITVNDAAVKGSREVWHDIVAYADDSGWTGDAAWAGGYRWWKLDETAAVSNEFARLGLKSSGSTGGDFGLHLLINNAGGTLVETVEFQDARTRFKMPVEVPPYTVASLPASGISAGATAYANNGRKSGEGASSGTGIPVWYDGTNWRTFYDNSVAAA